MSGLGKVEEGGYAAALFSEIWVADFEFRADPGERPWPLCMVAEEIKTGRVIRLWRNELLALDRAPFEVGSDALFVAYFASAEFGCFLQLGWPLPHNVVDLEEFFSDQSNFVSLVRKPQAAGPFAEPDQSNSWEALLAAKRKKGHPEAEEAGSLEDLFDFG